MICRVSRVNGTCGRANHGKSLGSAPMSPTLRTPRPREMDTAVRRMMVTSGDGTALVTYGRP
jgi:hypothetical protein